MNNLVRALSVLERIATGPVLTQSELTIELGVSRSTASDLLRQLQQLGFVLKDDRGYAAGPRLLALVLRTRSTATLSAAIRPVLRDLAATLGETAIFVVSTRPEPGKPPQVVALEEVQTSADLRYVAQIGRRYDAPSTTAGQAILAFAPDATHLLAASVAEEIRKRGYALTVNDAKGATVIAAPLRDPHGHVLGAISVIGPAGRMQDSEHRLWPALRGGLKAFTQSLRRDSGS